MVMLNILGIICGLLLLIILVFKKVNLLLAALVAVLVCGLTNGLSMWETFETFAAGMGNYFGGILLVFLFASIYGQALTDSGYASAIAYCIIDFFKKSRYTLLAVPIITAVLVYSGISVFVVVFTVMPIGVMLLKECNINKSILPGLINFGATTFAMTCLPGTPQLNNIIPSEILGTSPMAAPVLGIIGSVSMLVMGLIYFRWQINRYQEKGRVYDPTTVPDGVTDRLKRDQCPPMWKAIVSILTLMILYLGLSNGWFGDKVATYRAINTGMIVATLVIYFLNFKVKDKMNQAIVKGSVSWVMPLIYLCAVIGLGAVIKSTQGYQQIIHMALKISGNVYVSAACSTTLISGITGSASGGIQIALESLSGSWLARGANPEVLHRICAVASGGLDSLPHAGGLFTVFAVCNESHKSGYYHIFYTTVVIPVITTFILLVCVGFGFV